MEQILELFSGVSAKDFVSPVLGFIGLLLNGWYFSRKIERYKAQAAVYLEKEKDFEKSRREAFFRLSNATSISISTCKRIFNASQHPNKYAMIDALLPGLSQLWQGIRAIETEAQNIHLSLNELGPFKKVARAFGVFFFILDNKGLGNGAYVKKLSTRLSELSVLAEEARTYARERMEVRI